MKITVREAIERFGTDQIIIDGSWEKGVEFSEADLATELDLVSSYEDGKTYYRAQGIVDSHRFIIA